MYRLGIDIGSVSVNVAIVNENGKIVKTSYIRHKGKAFMAAKEAIEDIVASNDIEFIATTGTGAKVFASLIGAPFVNEIVAISRAMGHLHPATGSIVDIGGEDSKLIIFEQSGKNNTRLRVKDFSMNALCAAGTGSFLDQQASRLRFTIEEFSQVALKAKNIPRIAGRCTVFAKSDMIHLQQIATPDYEIVAGLCYALARNFKGNITKGKEIRTPVAFIGGVAANAGMRQAIRNVFELNDQTFFVPENFTAMGAIGAVYAVVDDPSLKVQFRGLDHLNAYLLKERNEPNHEPLSLSPANLNITYAMKPVTQKTRAYLGVDVGSISTNLVLIDEEKNVLAKRYLMTEGRPLEAVKRGLAEIGDEIGDRVEILGAGTTGSGRYLTADFLGADIVRNEITAQAQAAISIDPTVDTIFEIGGQDSKYISIDNGVIVDFEMNKACAAGTGSFLEEQAERLDISIKEEFGNLALQSKKPVKMGERCTVFIESDVIHQQQRGSHREDIISGLAYSIVQNYLNKVVVDRRVGKRIFFQGGTAFNKGVVAAFEKVVGMPITVPSHHDVTGAIGVAILAMKEKTWDQSGFKGFDLSKRPYTVDTFECKGCENLCEIRRVTVENETPLYYGSRCEKYDVVRRGAKKEMADLFSMREEILNEIYDKKGGEYTVGIPKILHMHELLPFWKTFLGELGINVVVSDITNKKTIRDGVENIIVESCFPIKLAHGHVMNLLQKGIRNIFIPSVISLKKPSLHARKSFACQYAPSLPYTIKGSIDFDDRNARLLTPIIRFGEGNEIVLNDLVQHLKPYKISKRTVKKAFEKAIEVQDSFYRRLTEMGQAYLNSLKSDEKIMVIIGRPYNSADAGANLNIHKKLLNLGVQAIPMDMLPVNDMIEDPADLEQMYWGYGQKILKAARAVKNTKNLYAIYVTSFGCGPDSFIAHFFKKIMGNKPYLSLEIDEHSADAGIVTRLEAFLDSINNAQFDDHIYEQTAVPFEMNGKRRKIYIPYMCDHSHTLAAAFRACGVSAEVMPESTEETVLTGRKFTSGKECYPCILTTGDMLRVARSESFDAEISAFFMPSGEGPCRFGQYNRFHRMVLDEAGFANVPIYAPNQDHRFYKQLNIVGSKFSRLGWRAVVAADLLTKILHETRPYEKNSGETDLVYGESLSKVCASIERGAQDIDAVLKDVLQRFRSIDRISEKRPTIGLVGEIYIRSNKFSNSQLVRTIEQLGGEVWLAPVSEWISYVNYTGKRKSKKRDGLLGILNFVITEYIQNKDEHLLEEIFVPFIKYGPEPKIKDILEKASPYIHDSFEGEAVLTVGKSVDFAHKGVAGIVNAMPFTCMPGTVSSAIMRLIQKNHEIPVINIAYDGQGSSNILTRLEAFMHQVKEHIRA
ncbi:MAG: acyl-CoA dehydratase activase [Syntrophorhabdus sp.]